MGDCPICLEQCLHPLALPCGHIFCYLCIKGVALQQHTQCALCRQPFPAHLIRSPEAKSSEQPVDSFSWFYEGRNGWWQYDERTNKVIEEAFEKKEEKTDILVAGALYEIDFVNKVQFKQGSNSRKRAIKREIIHDVLSRKGIAGIPSPLVEEELELPNIESITISDDE